MNTIKWAVGYVATSAANSYQTVINGENILRLKYEFPFS